MNKVTKVDLGYVDTADLVYDAFSDALSSSWTSDNIGISSTGSIDASKLAATHSKWSDSLTIKADTVGTVGTICDSFATIGATIAENFDIKMPENTIGKSVLDKLQ